MKNSTYTLRVFIVISLILSSITVFARGVYQTDQDFLAETFNQIVPKSKVVWVKGELATTITEILGHKYVGLRIRYWRTAERSVWILEEIGKEKPITFGVVIADKQIETIKVLALEKVAEGRFVIPHLLNNLEMLA